MKRALVVFLCPAIEGGLHESIEGGLREKM